LRSAPAVLAWSLSRAESSRVHVEVDLGLQYTEAGRGSF
jgi:hypothetical protein